MNVATASEKHQPPARALPRRADSSGRSLAWALGLLALCPAVVLAGEVPPQQEKPLARFEIFPNPVQLSVKGKEVLAWEVSAEAGRPIQLLVAGPRRVTFDFRSRIGERPTALTVEAREPGSTGRKQLLAQAKGSSVEDSEASLLESRGAPTRLSTPISVEFKVPSGKPTIVSISTTGLGFATFQDLDNDCTTSRLESVTSGLGQVPQAPEVITALIGQAVSNTCGTRFPWLAASASVRGLAPRDLVPVLLMKGLERSVEQWMAVCPAGLAALHTAAEKRPLEGRRYLFAACQLGPLGFATEEEFSQGFTSAPVLDGAYAAVMYHQLKSAGVDLALARYLTRRLAGIRPTQALGPSVLPTSTSFLEPRWCFAGGRTATAARPVGCVEFSIWPEEVRVLDTPAVALRGGAVVPADRTKQGLIGPLLEKLSAVVTSSNTTSGKALVFVDRAATYATLMEVLATARAAGLRDFQLAVSDEAGALNAIQLAVESTDPSSPHDKPVRLAVQADGFLVQGTDRIPLRDSRYDYPELNRRLSSLREALPPGGRLELSAAPATRFEVIVATLDAVRWTVDRQPLAADVSLGK